ncbi:DNA-directed RNA polymerase I subunit RPA1-like [Rhopilema esculentum]|uniref:DNA-directed RNA polymerase I subunit RPA1-like n=1 Tax=Rhopilema esculentum TaxID=499914 RepID=UPI0031E392F7
MFSTRMHGVSFQTFSTEDIKKQSVRQITNPETFDELLHPNPGGLYDRNLGPTDKTDICGSCGLNYVFCPGHLGHIELPLPVYHPIFFRILLQFVNLSCYNCHSLLISRSKEHLLLKQLFVIEKGQPGLILDLEEIFNAGLSESDHLNYNDKEDSVVERIDSFLNTVSASIQDCPEKTSKNTTKYRQLLVKEFLGTTKTKKCPRCTAQARVFKSQYNSRLYMKPLSAKAAKRQHTLKTESNITETENVDENKENDPQEEKELDGEEVENGKQANQTFVNPIEVRDHLRKVFQKSKDLLKAIFGSTLTTESADLNSVDMFFIDLVAVPPSRFRPVSSFGEKRFENPQTANLNRILIDCKLVCKCLEETQKKDKDAEDNGQTTITMTTRRKNSAPIGVTGKTPAERLQNAWIKLQIDVNCHMDSDLDKLSMDKVPGIRQLLEKKEGLFRKHMMGKRVNFAARSVISPDPYLNTDEIGIPEIFAKKLTYAQPVTPWNCQKLRTAVTNGPNNHPGAVMVEHEDGRKVILSATNKSQREAIAKRLLTPVTNEKPQLGCKKVYRHLVTGDVMLLNRQPTLHRPSIMAHKARVLPNERTIRLHYANCKAYNADFDGDEMNAHFPQNELGRSEAYNLVSTNFQYLSPKDGKPLSGLIQDHVVSGVSMTSRGVLFNKEDYHQLVFGALTDKPGKLVVLPPCILKPERLWSGKQVISTVLVNIIPDKNRLNLDSKAKVNDTNWPKTHKKQAASPLLRNVIKDPFLNEVFVIIRSGEIMTGILDKNQYGSSQFGLVHCVYEVYGGVTSGKLLSALARLFTIYLRLRGFSLGVEDILVTQKANRKRWQLIESSRCCGEEAAASALGLPENCERNELTERLQKAQYSNQGIDLKQLDLAMKKQTDMYQNKINSACVPQGLYRQFPDNSLQLMVQSGAKGSSVNCMQISSLLGQIELEGRRPPLMLSGRSLPSFLAYDTSPRAGGFVDGRFLTGIRPQEYFFHCMAGREGLVDTAVKTSRSGYLQRCLIKHLEGLMVQYDLSVRDSDGSVVQFLYGDDGVDVLKSQYLGGNQFQFIARNYKCYMRQLKPHLALKAMEKEEATKKAKKVKKWINKHGMPTSSTFIHSKKSPYLLFEDDHKETLLSRSQHSSEEVQEQLFNSWANLNAPTKHSYESKCRPCPDPVLSILRPDCHFGSISEAFFDTLNEYIAMNPNCLLSKENDRKLVRTDQFYALMLFKYARSLAEPGEAVGLLAGQSIGEPSTQMTLNTFHFAGRGEMNVTLGIPRLREILMTASSAIKTPTMDVLVWDGAAALKQAKKLQKKLNRVTLSDVIQKIEVFESLAKDTKSGAKERYRQFRIRMEFLHRSVYKDDYSVTPKDILVYVERFFLRRIIMAVRKLCRVKAVEKQMKAMEERLETAASFEDDGRDQGGFLDEDENDDVADVSDEELAGDDDAANSKSKSRQMQFSSYDEPDDEEKVNQSESDSEDESSRKRSPDAAGVVTDDAEVLENEAGALENEAAGETEKEKRLTSVLSLDTVLDYSYDEKKNLWCDVTVKFPVTGTKVMLLSLIEALAEKAVVNEAIGIKRAFLSESIAKGEEGKHRMKTEGVNILELWHYPEILQLSSLYSNDIHAVARTYGIEAARQVIIKEITNVFRVYGIQIDPRHLSLVADYMTFEGSYKPFNRQGIESNPFPLQKMTFETTTHFLREASAFGRVDTLDSPSSRLVVGRVVKSGTGIFDLRQPLKW